MFARVIAAAAWAAVNTSPSAAGPQEDLSACRAIADPTERLACYDRLAGRPATPAPPAAPKSSSAAPTAAASPAVAAAQPEAPAAASKPAAPAADARSFGSYSVEHPAAPPVAETLSVRVAALGNIDGKPTVTFDGGALWVLDEVDPLLAVGDTVTIRRGLLGSFLLETSTRRVHHVRRIR